MVFTAPYGFNRQIINTEGTSNLIGWEFDDNLNEISNDPDAIWTGTGTYADSAAANVNRRIISFNLKIKGNFVTEKMQLDWDRDWTIALYNDSGTNDFIFLDYNENDQADNVWRLQLRSARIASGSIGFQVDQLAFYPTDARFGDLVWVIHEASLSSLGNYVLTFGKNNEAGTQRILTDASSPNVFNYSATPPDPTLHLRQTGGSSIGQLAIWIDELKTPGDMADLWNNGNGTNLTSLI